VLRAEAKLLLALKAGKPVGRKGHISNPELVIGRKACEYPEDWGWDHLRSGKRKFRPQGRGP